MRKRRRVAAGEPYAPAVRLAEVKSFLNSTGGASVYDIAERFGVSVRTAIRYIRALQAANEPLYDDSAGPRKVWRLMASARNDSVTLTKAQMVALFLSRRVFDFLAGTGFKEDLDDVFARLEATLRRRDIGLARNLDRKIFDVNEAPHIYADRLDDVNDVLTALLSEERLRVVHGSGVGRPRTLLFDPYTLLVYKKGLYLVGYSHHHAGIRTLSLDDLRDVEWRKGEKFEYPADYDPANVAAGAFGLITGPSTRVRILFTQKVARFIRRRQWHPTQRIRRVDGGVELVMDVQGTTELVSWLLQWGDQAKLLEPEKLREDLALEIARMGALYGAPPSAQEVLPSFADDPTPFPIEPRAAVEPGATLGGMQSATKKLALGAALAGLAIWGGYATIHRESADAKLFVGRIWIDKLPKKDTEQMEVFVALSDDPLGVFQRRSQFEGSYSIFKYELRGDDKAVLLFPQDKSKHEVKYKARKCDVKDFDYCMDLEGAPRGAKKYLSRKEWELDATDLADLEKQLAKWQASLPVDRDGD